MKTFNDLQEGLQDPNIFKAFFLAGGPGSGKSYVVRKTTGGTGLRIVNSDDAFEFLLKKANLSLKMPQEEEEPREVQRSRAKRVTKRRMGDVSTGKGGYLEGRIGLILDGTGKDFNNIQTSSDMLKGLGYDTYMIFVNTSLEVALERNAQRPRSLPEPLVIDSWNRVQNNIGKFQNYFGAKNMLIVDNNKSNEDVMVKAYKQVQKFIRRPVQNKTAKDWIKQQKELR